ncbi:Protein of unknown function DUF674 [Dillenia turbinata]|uniref:DUF674 domain-containing protein n=1 Tax=Dillenia turbinata TaxID=194707 RepID=A0AAN8VGP2_9MAGN
MAQTQVELKLLIHTKARKVLFAEAGKDFVDFLCSLLILPVGTVIRLLSKSMTGTLGTLYESIENLSLTYMQPNMAKDILLKPESSSPVSGAPFLLTGVESASKKFYICSYNHGYIAETDQAICPSCNLRLSTEARFVPRTSLDASSSSSSEGYVKGVVTYMVMDDLTVKPMSTISSITVLHKFNVKDIGDLEEKIVNLGMAKGLKLLREALHSKDVLTNVFLGKNSAGKI